MSDKFKVPLHFEVTVEERFTQPADKQWHAQFRFYPLGYFRGQGHSPGAALAAAWRNFRREVDPGKRWWAVVLGPARRFGARRGQNGLPAQKRLPHLTYRRLFEGGPLS